MSLKQLQNLNKVIMIRLELYQNNAILDFLKIGQVLEGIRIGDKKEKVFSLLGKPNRIVGDDFSGFLEFKNGIRFRYVDHLIDDLEIIFIKNVKLPIQLDLLPESSSICKKTLIGNFVQILSFAKIKWRSWDEHSLDAFSIRTEGDVLVIFDLESSKLERIIYIGKDLIRQN